MTTTTTPPEASHYQEGVSWIPSHKRRVMNDEDEEEEEAEARAQTNHDCRRHGRADCEQT